MKRMGIVALLVTVTAITTWVVYHKHTSSPEYAMDKLDQAFTSRSVDAAKGYLTERGASVLEYLLSEGEASPRATPFLSSKIHRDGGTIWYQLTGACDCSGLPSEGPGVIEIVLVENDGRWLFDNVLYKSYCGLEMDIHADFLKDHPILSTGIVLMKNPGTTLKVMAVSFFMGYFGI